MRIQIIANFDEQQKKPAVKTVGLFSSDDIPIR
jgi:hypothetical protein